MNYSTLTAPVPTRLSERLLVRKVLVTGSSKGIGRGIAVRLAQEGADVVINYNSDPQGAEEALAEIQALGRRGAIVRADLGSVAEVRRAGGAERRGAGRARRAGQQRRHREACRVLGRHRERTSTRCSTST